MAVVILLNGPPRCGKDTAGKILERMLPGKTGIMKFAEPLKTMTHAAISLLRGDSSVPAHDAFEETKDQINPYFFNTTPRGAYIRMSESFCKKQFGPQVFGESLVERIGKTDLDYVIVTDSGFQEEVDVVQEQYPCCLVHISRDGTSFSGDSRRYLVGPDARICNNGTEGELFAECAELVAHILRATENDDD